MRKFKEIERAGRTPNAEDMKKIQEFTQNHDAMLIAQDAMMRCSAAQEMAKYYARQQAAMGQTRQKKLPQKVIFAF